MCVCGDRREQRELVVRVPTARTHCNIIDIGFSHLGSLVNALPTLNRCGCTDDAELLFEDETGVSDVVVVRVCAVNNRK